MTADVREHAFDGITEFDNRLPNWWLWTFYLACIYSVGYWVHYHSLGTGDQPAEAYVAEQRAAAEAIAARLAANPITEQSLLQLVSEPAFVAAGKRLFEDPQKCAQCHRADGSGAIGPNLTDDRWIYGGAPMDVFTTILKGREQNLAKGFMGGMQAWESSGLQFVLQTTAYVLSIRGTNLPGKPPEPNAIRTP